jgi:hypothetical protein
MAYIMNQLPAHDVSFDVSLNPELILMRMQGDDYECDVEESQWLSGTYATQPKQSSYDL